MAKELKLQGTFRFGEEFAQAVEDIVSGCIDVRPMITHRFPLTDAAEAFRIAADRSQSVKVHLSFEH